MLVLVWLQHEVTAFRVSATQLDALSARLPRHRFLPCASETAFLEALPNAAAALVWRFDAAWYARAPKLELVATPAAGRERVARDPAGRARSVHGAFHGKIMAETLLGMVLYWSRRLDRAEGDRVARRWDREQFSTTRRLAGETALIVGYGALGRECAERLKALGLRVLGVKRHPSGDPAPADAVHPASELPSLLTLADHVVSTLPSDTGTDRLFDARAFARMRKSAYFYNLGRGNAVDEPALVTALESGALAGAFLDVFAEEPLPAASPLWTAPNLALLPHASAISRDYLDLWFDELAPALATLGNGR